MARTQQSAPQAVDTERVLLGTILVDSTKIVNMVDILPPGKGQWFYDEKHELVYDAMMTLYERNDAIDLETVCDTLRLRGKLDKMGGSVYVAEMMEYVSTTANVAFHARIVRDKSLHRALINLGSDLTADGYEQADIQEVIAKANEGLMNIASAQAVSSLYNLSDLMRDSISRAQNADARDLTGLQTGFHGLDRHLGGFQDSDLLILAARPSMGKSSLALQFAVSAGRAAAGLPVLFFSLEMSKEQLSHRILCSEAHMDANYVKRGLPFGPEWGVLMNAAESIRQSNILIDDTSSLSVLDVRVRAKRLQAERGLGMIFIDYLQLMSAGKRKENRQQEVAAISRDLKLLAKDLNVPVMALSQLSRDVEREHPPVPKLSDLRDSGAIEQDADVVMFIYRGDIYQNEEHVPAKILISKQRNGPSNEEVHVAFEKRWARFEELQTQEHREPIPFEDER